MPRCPLLLAQPADGEIDASGEMVRPDDDPADDAAAPHRHDDLTADITASGANGLDTGSEGASRWYSIHAIRKSSDGTKAYVSLLGSEMRPGSEVAVYDVATGKFAKRILLKPAGETGPAGSAPMRMLLHPDGRHLFVANRFSNFISIIDTRRDEVVSEVPLDFYAQGMTFSPDGRIAWVANRYLDEVLVVDIQADGDAFSAKMRVIGGLDDQAYFAPGGIGKIMQQSCGTTGCHDVKRGGFVAGLNLRESFTSALDHIVPGRAAPGKRASARPPRGRARAGRRRWPHRESRCASRPGSPRPRSPPARLPATRP